MKVSLSRYSEEIKDVAAFAKSINFNPETGNIMDLMKAWLNHAKAAHEAIINNRDESIRIIKSVLTTN